MKPIPETIEIVGERALLRTPIPEDIHGMQAIFNDPQNMVYIQHLYKEEGWSLEDIEHRYDQKRIGQKNQTMFELSLVDRATDELVGSVSFFHIERAHDRAEAGLVVDHAHWGRGIALEALRLALDYAFSELELHRVEFVTLADNQRACRLMEKLGISLEGIRKECVLQGDRYLDQAIFAAFHPSS